MKRALPASALMLALAAQPALSDVESCMVDTWIADMGDIADMMALQMQGQATPVNGEVSMQIAGDGKFLMLVDDMTINVQLPDVPAMDVKVVGFSAGRLDAVDNAFIAAVDEYDLVGSADVLGQTLDIPFSSETGIGGGGIGWFECADDTLRFETAVGGVENANRMPRLWRRR